MENKLLPVQGIADLAKCSTRGQNRTRLRRHRPLSRFPRGTAPSSFSASYGWKTSDEKQNVVAFDVPWLETRTE